MAILEIIKSNTKIDFAGKFTACLIISTIMVGASIALALTKLKSGVDFRGGAEIQVKFAQSVPAANVRAVLSEGGFANASVQSIGAPEDNELMIKVSGDESNLNAVSAQVSELLTKSLSASGAEIRKVDIVGPKAGAQLRLSGFQAMAWALLAIMVYIGLRFEFKYAPGAIVATFHDVALVLGVYAVFGIEFTLQTVAAVLAVIGYSVNDTVIVYDRVREHVDMNTGRPLTEIINTAINETMSRTILTSGTTLAVCIAMLVLGGGAIFDFFVAMTVGIIVGTYSSIFIAAPITIFFDRVMGKNNKNVAVSAK